MSWLNGRIDNLADLNNCNRIVREFPHPSTVEKTYGDEASGKDIETSSKTNPRNKLEVYYFKPDFFNPNPADFHYRLTLGNSSFDLPSIEVIANAIDYELLGFTPTISDELWDTAGELLKSL